MRLDLGHKLVQLLLDFLLSDTHPALAVLKALAPAVIVAFLRFPCDSPTTVGAFNTELDCRKLAKKVWKLSRYAGINRKWLL